MPSQNPMRKLILSVYVPTLILSFCQGLLLPVLPVFAEGFQVSFSLIGLVLAADGLGTLLMDLPAGNLLRRFDRRNIMTAGVLLIAVSVLALFWSQSIIEVFIYRVIAGVGAALWNLSRHAYLAEVTASHQRGRAIALFGGVNRIGVFAGPVLGGLLAANFGLRSPFLVFALLGVVTAVLAFSFVERGKNKIAQSKHHVFEMLSEHRRVFAVAGTAQLGAQMIRAARRIVIPLYASSVLGLGVESIGFIMSAAAFVDMSLFYVAGSIMDRFGRKFAIVPCFSIQAIGMCLVPFATGFIPLLLIASVIGFGNGLGSGTMMTLGADLAPPQSLNEFLGVWRLIGDTGFMASPVIVGAVADVLALAPAAVVMSGVGFAAAGLFAFGVPETLNRTAVATD